MSRTTLLAFVTGVAVLLAAILTIGAIEFARTGAVGLATVSIAGAALASLVVLVGVYFVRPSSPTVSLQCENCGRRVYPTLRSLDRRELLTCFTCGSEWVLPVRAPRDPPSPRTPRPTLAD